MLVGDPAQATMGRTALAGALITIIPVLMVWNGSLIGAGALVALFIFEFVVGTDFAAGLSWPIVRSFLYLCSSVWIFRELFLYRRKSSVSGDPIGGSGLIRTTGTVLVGGLGLLMAVGTADTLSPEEAGGLKTARQITSEQYRWMQENDIIGADERVFLMAEDSGLPYSDSGNVLTDKFVGAWWRNEGELESSWIPLGEICRVEKTNTTSDVAENLYTIHTYGEDSWLRILLPKSGNSAREFLARMNYLNDQKMHREVRSACDEERLPDWDVIATGNGIERDIVGPEQVDAAHMSWLRHNGYLTPKEELLKFYSHGHYSISTGGLLLTDAFFGGWAEDADGLEAWWFEHGEICSFEKVEDATKSKGPRYRIESTDNWFQFNAPDRGGQDTALIRQLEALNDAAMTDAAKSACEAMLKEKESDAEDTTSD